MAKKNIKKMCFICSKATIDSVYACLVMANGARMEGIESEIFFTFFGLDAVNKKRVDNLHIATVGNPGLHIPTMLGGLPEMEEPDMPPVSEFLEIISASGGKLWACKLAMEMFKLTQDDLVDDIDGVLTIGEFYDRADEENAHIVFI